MMLSSTILGAYGRIMLMLMLINISRKLSPSLPMRGRTSSISIGRTLRNDSDAFFFTGAQGPDPGGCIPFSLPRAVDGRDLAFRLGAAPREPRSLPPFPRPAPQA